MRLSMFYVCGLIFAVWKHTHFMFCLIDVKMRQDTKMEALMSPVTHSASDEHSAPLSPEWLQDVSDHLVIDFDDEDCDHEDKDDRASDNDGKEMVHCTVETKHVPSSRENPKGNWLSRTFGEDSTVASDLDDLRDQLDSALGEDRRV